MTTHIMLDLETWGTEPGCDIRSIGACVFDPVAGTVYGQTETGDHGCFPGIATSREDTFRKGMSFYIACDNPIIGRDDGANVSWIDTLGFTPHTLDPCYDINDNVYRRYPLHRDPRTVQWWSEQSDEAQAAFSDPVDLAEGLRQFGKWLRSVSPISDYYDIGEHDRRFPDNIRLWSHGAHFDGPILAAAYHAVGLPVPWHYRAPRDTRTAFDMAGIDDHSAWLKQHPGPLGIPHHALDDAICQARAVCGAWALVDVLDPDGVRGIDRATGI